MRTKFKFTRAGTASRLKRGVAAGLALATLGTGAPVLAKSPQAAEGPYIAVVSLARQRVTLYSKDGVVTSSPVSSGQRGRETPQGVFSIIAKEVDHQSTLYNDAEMPFMQRITWSGVALHAGNLPGYPASHGCIRLPWEFAKSLFSITPMHTRIVVSMGDAPPAPISHPTLFQPIAASEGAGAAESPLVAARQLKVTTAQQAMTAAKAAASARPIAAAKASDARKADRAAQQAEVVQKRVDAGAQQLAQRMATAVGDARIAVATAAHARSVDDLAKATSRATALRAEASLRASAAKAAVADIDVKNKASIAADLAATDAARLAEPVAVLVSRKLGKVYVRQAQQSVLELPITIKNADRPIGTQVFTAMSAANTGSTLAWNVLAVESVEPEPAPLKVRGKSKAAPVPTIPAREQGMQALDRITFPKEVLDRITPYLQEGSSLIVSDLGPSFETGRGTDLVVVTQGEEKAMEAVRHIVAQKKGWKRAVELVRAPE